MLPRSRLRFAVTAMLLLVVTLLVTVTGCASNIPNRDPMGEPFPKVVGENLDGDQVTLPDAFQGRPALLLVGYKQEAQFDADRWLLGLLQSEMDIVVREIPTIDGFIPGLLSSRINNGMRKGIPSEDWASVLTVYDDASLIVEFTGNQIGNNIRLILLDEDGRVRWFHDRGYSASKMLELKKAIEAL